MRRLILIAAIVLTTACSQSNGTSLGVVTDVEGSLTVVDSFTLLSGGSEIEFLPIPGQSYDFPLPHLREHLRTGEPVVVDWEIREEERFALSIRDG